MCVVLKERGKLEKKWRERMFFSDQWSLGSKLPVSFSVIVPFSFASLSFSLSLFRSHTNTFRWTVCFFNPLLLLFSIVEVILYFLFSSSLSLSSHTFVECLNSVASNYSRERERETTEENNFSNTGKKIEKKHRKQSLKKGFQETERKKGEEKK